MRDDRYWRPPSNRRYDVWLRRGHNEEGANDDRKAERVSAAVQSDSNVCADIEGFDFSNYDGRDIAEVRKFWLQYGVIRFRQDQYHRRTAGGILAPFRGVRHSSQAEAGGRPSDSSGNPGHQQCHEGRQSRAARMGNSEATWHTDTWFYERPPAGAILRGHRLPPTGGDTYFLSTYSAYETLPAGAEEQRSTGRQIFFQNVYDKTGKLRLGRIAPKSLGFSRVERHRPPAGANPWRDPAARRFISAARSEGAWIVGIAARRERDPPGAAVGSYDQRTDVFVQQMEQGRHRDVGQSLHDASPRRFRSRKRSASCIEPQRPVSAPSSAAAGKSIFDVK